MERMTTTSRRTRMAPRPHFGHEYKKILKVRALVSHFDVAIWSVSKQDFLFYINPNIRTLNM
jgi:hypothetical protein